MVGFFPFAILTVGFFPFIRAEIYRPSIGNQMSGLSQSAPASDGQLKQDGPGRAEVGAVSDRATRYLARIDAELDRMYSKLERKQFLERRISQWEELYGLFVETGGTSFPNPDGPDAPQAADFVLTIMGLAKRYAAV